MTNKEIGERIKAVRKEIDKTLEDIAVDTGLARSTIQRYETGKIERIKLPVISAIADSLGVNDAWLVGKSDKKHLSDVDRFARTAEIFNKKNSVFVTGRNRKHLEMYQALFDKGKDQVDALTQMLYDIQQREDALKASEPQLLAAHERTDIEMTPEEAERAKQHDLDLMRNKK